MGSDATSSTNTETNNLALDAKTTNGAGTQILDSIIVDPSDKVMVETIKQHTAAFEVLTKNSTIQLKEMLDLGEDVLALVNQQSIRMDQASEHLLTTGVAMLREAKEQGKYVIDLVSDVASQSLDLAGAINSQSDNRVGQALDLVADVSTNSNADTLKTITMIMAAFGLGAIFLTRK